jgi:SPOR domain
VRNAFFALLLVNIVYFAWAHWIDVPQPVPVNPALAKLPTLKLVEEVPPSQRPQPSTSKETQPASTACLSVGPFPDVANSAHAAALLKAKGFDPKQRAEQAVSSDGYWVYVGGFKTQADADHALVTLEHAGINDALIMPETAEAGRRVSLGLYSERGRADRRAEAVHAAGLDAQVVDRKVPNAIYWIDLAPIPGVNSVPLQDLFAEGVSSRIAVQPCPAAPGATPVSAATSRGIRASRLSSARP